jgi:hypothetical protein
MPELTITSPYIDSRADSNTCIVLYTMRKPYARVDFKPMTESTLTLCQRRLYPPVRDLEFGLSVQVSF